MSLFEKKLHKRNKAVVFAEVLEDEASLTHLVK